MHFAHRKIQLALYFFYYKLNYLHLLMQKIVAVILVEIFPMHGSPCYMRG